jgi:hypothetical protein
MCRRGLRTVGGSKIVRRIVRKNRRAVRQALRAGNEDTDRVVSVPYTD